MDFISKEQLIGLALFFAGTWILTACNRYERGIDEKLKDPKLRWALLDGAKNSVIKQKNFRGTIMTLVGVGVAIYGFVLILTNIK